MIFDVMVDVKMNGVLPIEADDFEDAVRIAKLRIANSEGYAAIQQMVKTKRCQLNDYELELQGIYRT